MTKMEQYFKSGKLRDVTLIAGENEFSPLKEVHDLKGKFIFTSGNKRVEAHRIVLSSASDYFAAMFTNDFGESFQNEIELQGVDPDALETLVAYCYTGNFN